MTRQLKLFRFQWFNIKKVFYYYLFCCFSGSLQGSGNLPFKRQSSLRLGDLPSTLERQRTSGYHQMQTGVQTANFGKSTMLSSIHLVNHRLDFKCDNRGNSFIRIQTVSSFTNIISITLKFKQLNSNN